MPSALFAGTCLEYDPGADAAGSDAGAGDHEAVAFRDRETACTCQDPEKIRDKAGEDTTIHRRLPGRSALSSAAQGKSAYGLRLYVRAKSQCICADMDHLSWIFSGGEGCPDGHAAAGFGLYRRGYAAGAGGTGDHGGHVQKCVRRYFYGRISDAVTLCDQRDQFLFRAGGQSGSGGGKPTIYAKEKSLMTSPRGKLSPY